ncbi:hypothetical protein ABK905_02090 [Acerihabitans sp. KWT182]|uniref:Uncharacterized protein n=1 Tax=Acerihabitans sp. KWT182 TaxID=3157919 RepID=A0AAU7QAI2_9GAMM
MASSAIQYDNDPYGTSFRATTPPSALKFPDPIGPISARAPHSDPLEPHQERKRLTREAKPAPRHIRVDTQYRLAVYLNKQTAAGINPEKIEDRQLAIQLLNSIEHRSDLMPGLARLALHGSHLYGERRGETLSPLQQKSLIGQMLCKLIYREDNINLRVLKLFAANRNITQRAFTAMVQAWPFPNEYEQERKAWREHYEAPEIPALYLQSFYKVQDESEGPGQNQTAIFNFDNLWVGSMSWTLMQFGARTLVLDDAEKLKTLSIQALLEVGIGLVSLFRQGLLSSGVEPTLYLGLVMYYLRARPGLSLDEILATESLDDAFALFKEELERRHIIAQRLYDSFAYYEVNYQRLAWRSRKAAAEELLKQHCGSADAAIMSRADRRAVATNPAKALMLSPDGYECVASGALIPDVNDFYRQEVDRFAGKVLALDVALLEAAFLPSDVSDDNLQFEDEQILQHSGIEWVVPRLTQRRTIHDMFYSNMLVSYHAKPDTFFLRTKEEKDQRLFALQTSEQGYLLRRITLDDPHLEALRPFMSNWPIHDLVPQHEFNLLTLNNADLMKSSHETLSAFLERYANAHYHIYRLKIHDLGYEESGTSLNAIMDTAAGYIVPFYGCITALRAGQHQVAFAECLVNGALVGLPLIFTGVKAGSRLFRMVVIGTGKTMVGPRFSASGSVIYRNTIPATRQLSGGIVATRARLGSFMDVMGRQVLKSVDPGFATLRSLSVLTKGLYLALLCRASLGLVGWQRNLAKVSGDLPKFVVATHAQQYQISYDKDGFTPLTVRVKGVTYPVFQIQNSSLVAVETGERTHDGQLLFAQLDLQNQFGIYKKYFCLSIGGSRCQMKVYEYPDFKIEMDAQLPRPRETQLFWLFTTSSPIQLVVVHPLHLLEFADSQWVAFEVNGRRWAFSHDNGTLIPADNLDDWRLPSERRAGVFSMIDLNENNRRFTLGLTRLHRRRKRETALPRVNDWGRRLVNYTLDEESSFGFPVIIHDDSSFNAQIGDFRYLLEPGKKRRHLFAATPNTPCRAGFPGGLSSQQRRFCFCIANGARQCASRRRVAAPENRRYAAVHREILY